ncbi:unnamed protein product [Acidocella sp. C78]|uniref:Crp/Fnr family transcriptional regulator n=1 Tax=Acidocella sp. C78 TaxID=1671486 RepID=UPI001BBCF26C|nr:helix-turn-helix domain-containing protein [Acidocella sp. C78]CAG4926520.1 unnamed protein product [Acidocella sp. C78]
MLEQRDRAHRSPINLSEAIIPGLCAGCGARHIGLCDALADEDLHFLASVARQTTVARGHSFAIEGDSARYFFNINAGTARLHKDLPDGRRQITGFVGPGDFVGLAADDRYTFSAEAIEDVRLCRFDRTELRGVFSRFPAIERRLLDVASHELIVAQEQMLLLGRKSAIERLASFIDGWSRRAILCGGGTDSLRLPMTRTDLADYLGLTIETVSRALSALRKQGVIEVTPDHNISVVRPHALHDIARAGA